MNKYHHRKNKYYFSSQTHGQPNFNDFFSTDFSSFFSLIIIFFIIHRKDNSYCYLGFAQRQNQGVHPTPVSDDDDE